MNLAILHDAVTDASSPDDLDVLEQADAVEAALAALGHRSTRIAVSLDLQRVEADLATLRPDLVFNLVESVGGHGRLIHLVPALLDTLAIPYTGCPTGAVFTTSSKPVAKRALRGAGIPTPAWRPGDSATFTPGRWIVKSVWEHASRGLDDRSVIHAATADDLDAAMRAASATLGGEAFAEAYIDGREFNLAFIADPARPGGVRPLPPAEIQFVGYEPQRPRIVGYAAKWDEASFEYEHTQRRLDFDPADQPLLDRLIEIGLACWRLFELRGYARVDFRVDDAGRPWVLEVNVNPCLSPDAGFAAAATHAGLTMKQAIDLIIQDAAPSPRRHGDTEKRPVGSGQMASGEDSVGVSLQPVLNTGPLSVSQCLRGEFTFRNDPHDSDVGAIRRIVTSTGFFAPPEIEIAVELIEQWLKQGDASGYRFVFADAGHGESARAVGYACFGEIPCTVGSYDLYWIAVDNHHRGGGMGRALLAEVERQVRELGGRRLYAETSGKAQYQPTRAFYLKTGFIQEACFPDFYAPGDDKVVYAKPLASPAPSRALPL